MITKQIAPFGTWVSPVTPDLLTAKTVGLSALAVDGPAVYWLETRPNEAGRSTLMRWVDGTEPVDLTPAPFNLGSRVHEYGGGAYAVSRGRIVFSDRRDNAVWLIEPGTAPRRLAMAEGCRYADFIFDPGSNRILAIREDHRGRAPTDPAAAIVALDPASDPAENAGTILVEGPDFLAAPRLSPDGTRLAWLAWDHPDMPWDATRLYLAEIGPDGQPAHPRLIAGHDAEAIVQPAWSPDGTLYFSSDRSGWWNVYVWRNDTAVPVAVLDAEIGGPHWAFKPRHFVPMPDGGVLCAVVDGGIRRAGSIRDGKLTHLPMGQVAECPWPHGDGLVYLATPPDGMPAIRRVPDRDGAGTAVTVRAAGPMALSAEDVSVGRPIEFPTRDGGPGDGGTGDGGIGHAFYYPPRNARFAAPDGELPPLLVVSHGGPTGMAGTGFSLAWHWWTSRGFAVVDVNYGGSTGFGRAYRRRLDGQWGVVDVADCIAAARSLAERGLADRWRIAIRGGSAGGFTTLAALVQSDLFAAGASLYGVADLALLARDTHKFEARYLDRLVGPLPEAQAVYNARSPANHVADIRCPVIFFQGLDDKVVPPNQAQTMVDAMTGRGLPVAYYTFEGEGHGFRKAETIRRAIELELDFYGRIFGFTPAGLGERVMIRNRD